MTKDNIELEEKILPEDETSSSYQEVDDENKKIKKSILKQQAKRHIKKDIRKMKDKVRKYSVEEVTQNIKTPKL